MATFKVLTGFCLGAGRDVFPGDTVETPGDLTEQRARQKVLEGCLIEFTPEVEAPAPAGPPPAEDPSWTARDPQPYLRRVKKGS